MATHVASEDGVRAANDAGSRAPAVAASMRLETTLDHTDSDAAPVSAAAAGIDAAMMTPDATPARPRKRGRPALMTREQLVASIRARAAGPDGLFRVHLTDSDLYARARRMFGSWAAAVAAAGVDYAQAIDTARRRSLETRRQRG